MEKVEVSASNLRQKITRERGGEERERERKSERERVRERKRETER